MKKNVQGPPPVQRLRITFATEPLLRYISHLDLAKSWERTLRRAKAPVAYTQGFHPQPRIQFAGALPVGVSSDCELMDVWMERRVSPEDFRRQVSESLPPGIRLLDVVEVPLKGPALQAILVGAEYEVVVDDIPDADAVAQSVEDFLGKKEILHEKRTRKGTKFVNIRPLVEDLRSCGAPAVGAVCLRMRLSHRPGASARATDVLDALGLSKYPSHVVRKKLFFSE